MKTLHTHLPNLAKLALVSFFLLLAPVQAHARDVSFSWTANPQPTTGYKLYYKTGTDSSPPYDGTGLNAEGSPIFLGNVTTTTVTGLSPNETYQFTLTAYNDTGESDYSTIVSVLPLSFPSPTINIMSQN
ncbi:fibronectin type III domain-containing protein [Desulfocapsa sp. AH-315-G09]|nr:fibronectin type III domain-containing protein [Desulfocapsa sp.]MBN4065326.1 fibronectin type III domain-containing protein [Desulfocapsa sp. AH-315-G09]